VSDEVLRANPPRWTRIAAAKTVVFFYSGHGYQINGSNYLLPINTAIDPSGPQVSLDTVFRSLSGAPDDAVKLVLLDACRTNVNLKVSGGTTLEGLPGWSPGLGKPSSKAPPRTLFGFAASYGKTAISGIPGSVSPYTSALLRSIREPGLEIRPLLRRIRDDVFVGTRRRQAPQDEGLAKIPEPFYLREPVEVPAVIAGWPHSNLLVILNGEMVLDSNQNPHDRLRLKAGENELLLLVSNGKTFNKGHNWERPEGWSYRLELNLPDGRKEVFEDREKVPFKDGPHHGKVFPVARARIIVDDATAETTLPSEFREDKLWKTAVPLWAQDQERLYERSVKDLPLDDILDPTAMPNFGIVPAPAVLALLREILTSGRFLGQGVAVPELTFFVVWGNKEYKPLVTACIEPKMKDRVNDLRASMAAALKRHPRPFDSFDQALNDCIREAATTGDSTFRGSQRRTPASSHCGRSRDLKQN
jgi:hypothetical protein